MYRVNIFEKYSGWGQKWLHPGKWGHIPFFLDLPSSQKKLIFLIYGTTQGT